MKEIILFNFDFFGHQTIYFTSFQVTPSTSNFDSIQASGKFLFKMGCKFIFLVFFEELLYVSL
jgi:hypothetical protein